MVRDGKCKIFAAHRSICVNSGLRMLYTATAKRVRTLRFHPVETKGREGMGRRGRVFSFGIRVLGVKGSLFRTVLGAPFTRSGAFVGII